MIVAGIDIKTGPITWRKVVTPTESRGDLRGVPLGAADRDVKIAVVVRHLNHRSLGRPRLVIRLVLDKVVDRVGGRPDLFVQATVDLRRDVGDPECAQDLTHFFRYVRLSRV